MPPGSHFTGFMPHESRSISAPEISSRIATIQEIAASPANGAISSRTPITMEKSPEPESSAF